MKNKSYSIPLGMVFKKYYCSECGKRLIKFKTHRIVTKKDKDYYQYHDIGTYPRIDYDVYNYEFTCDNCKRNISYTEQCIIEKIQKKLKKRILLQTEIKENYKIEQEIENKKILKRNIIIPVVLLTIAFGIMIICDKEKSYKDLILFILVYLISVLFCVITSIRSHKGKNILKWNEDYSSEKKKLLEKVHAFSTNNKRLIEKSDKCFCFYCKKTMDSNEITRFLDNDNTALCPHCGVDAIIPDCIDVDIDETLINDMNNYWF